MPFPVELKYIRAAEEKLGISLPDTLVEFLQISNGGEVQTEEDDWTVFPVTDPSDRKRLKRTWNGLVENTTTAREWSDFPPEAVAIASNDCGDYLVLLPDERQPKRLSDKPFVWYHETGELEPVYENLATLLMVDDG